MPKQKKRDIELTKDEAMKKLFQKPIREKLYKEAHEKEKKGKRTS